MTADDQECKCGISTLWALPTRHPFTPVCQWHDRAYVKGSPFQTGASKWTRKEVDDRFLVGMLIVADKIEKESGKLAGLKYRALAHVLWGITRTLGGRYWEGDE